MSTWTQSIYDTRYALIPHLYLGICPHDKVLQLNDFVIYGWPVTLFNDVVSCSPLSFFRWFWLLDTPRNLFDRHLFLPHHHRHCGQNGPIAPNEGLQWPCATSVTSNQPIYVRFMMVKEKGVNKRIIRESWYSSEKEETRQFPPIFLGWYEHWHSSTGKVCHSASNIGHCRIRSLVLQEHQHFSTDTTFCSSTK